MRPCGVIIAIFLCVVSLHFSCLALLTSSGDSTVVSNEVDTIAEAFELYFQWVNPTDVKVEFDMVVDNSASVHFELPAGSSLAILVGLNQEEDRDPITIEAENVTVIRVNTNCPDDVVFDNVNFGDVFAGTMIPFAQGAVADEGTLVVDSAGATQPVTFVCYSAWQIIIEESSITVTAFDREPSGAGESEVDVEASLEPTPDPETSDVDTSSDDAARPAPEDTAPRIIDGPPSIGSV